MAVKGFSASNYLSVADHADFDIPNGDWSELIILRPDSVSGTFTPISNGTAYSANTRQWFMFDNSIECIVNGTSSSSVNLSSGTWYLVCAKRSGTTLTIRVVEMGTTTVSASSGATLSAASSPASSNFLGRENDTTANPWNGAISDWLFIPGTAISDADLQDIATGTAIDSFGWYASNAVFWAIPETTSNTDQIGGKTVTVNGTMTTETDPPDLERFGGASFSFPGTGAASFGSQLGGENYAAQYSSGNYHSIADAAGMTLPNNDWTWLLTVRTGSDVTTAQDVIINGVYQAANVLDVYIQSSSFNLDISNLGTDESVSCSANTWYLLAITRSSGTFTLRAIPFGSGTVSESTGTAISAAYDSSSGYHFGHDEAGSFPLLGGAIGDALFLPGEAVSDADLINIAQNNHALNSFSWYSSREFHLVAYLDEDFTGNHTVTETGSTTIIAGPSGFIREGGSADLTASGAGAFSGVASTLNATELSAAGSGGLSADANADFAADVNAAGVGAFSGETQKTFAADLDAIGIGGTSLEAFTGQVDLIASGVGAADFDINSLNESELTSIGASGFVFNITAAKPFDINAPGIGGFSADGREAHKTDISADGVGALSADSHAFKESDLSSIGTGSFNFEPQSFAESSFDFVGIGSTNFELRDPSVFLFDGLGVSTFITRLNQSPVTIPGSNMFIIANNAIDRAVTLSATTTATGFDVDNIKLDRKSSVWRSTATTAQTITATWTNSETFSGLGLAFTNLVLNSTVQLKLYTNTADPSPVYDSGQLTVDFSYEPPTGFSSIGLSSFAFGGGNYFSYLLAETITAKKLELIVTSSGNPDSYIEISRIISGFAYTPTIGASYDLPINYLDNTDITITDAGDTVSNRGTIKKQMSLSLNVLNKLDRHGLAQVTINRGRGLPVFASIYENSQTPEEKLAHTIYGVFENLPGQSIRYKDAYNSSFTITEV